MSGSATNPTATSAMGYFGEVPLKKTRKRCEFSPGAATGSEQLYILAISDSALPPFPILSLNTRITYKEE